MIALIAALSLAASQPQSAAEAFPDLSPEAAAAIQAMADGVTAPGEAEDASEAERFAASLTGALEGAAGGLEAGDRFRIEDPDGLRDAITPVLHDMLALRDPDEPRSQLNLEHYLFRDRPEGDAPGDQACPAGDASVRYEGPFHEGDEPSSARICQELGEEGGQRVSRTVIVVRNGDASASFIGAMAGPEDDRERIEAVGAHLPRLLGAMAGHTRIRQSE